MHARFVLILVLVIHGSDSYLFKTTNHHNLVYGTGPLAFTEGWVGASVASWGSRVRIERAMPMYEKW